MVVAGAAAAPTVAGILDRAAVTAPSTVAVRGPGGEVLSYADLVASARALGRALRDRGREPGDRVALWLADTVPHVQVYAACALAGFVVVPVNARFTEHEARHLVADSGSSILLSGGATTDRAAALGRSLGLPQMRLDADADALAALHRRAADGDLGEWPAPAPDDPYIIGYTSGTTGAPKGAVLTQGSVAELARMNALAYRLPLGSVAAMTGSLSFVAVVPAHVVSHFYVRGTVCLLGPWTVASLLDAVETHRATFTYVPSPLLAEVADAFAAAPERWRTLTTVLHSASKAPEEKLRRLADVIGPRLVEGWGMTENSGGLMTVTAPEDVAPGSRRLSTVGRPVPGVDIRLVAEDGRSVPHDGASVGELVFRSPALMAGYWRDPEATARALADGWFRSGDLGTMDEDGYVTIVERRVDLIVSGGMNVYPFEVEQVLLRHPAVALACVVGVPHPRWGQTVAAAVVPRPGLPVTEQELVAHCRTYLASYKKPTRIEFMDALPTTPSLKVSRSAVRRALR
ncbi:class I adenylate-forming enzyme family protein [Acrocarpospora catenulata]|uniref:class I adenylate-forming enzyme family protein n=1 Tax=Acrocarpospora catenulata TaxID=2836182 RepID=UPI001BDAF2A3|nr:AMP-binding protein [Acrocarpospora catenulata]